MTEPRNRRERRAARAEGRMVPVDPAGFLKIADKFIDLANRENRYALATDIHGAFLYAAARYNAFVAKVVLEVPNHEAYVKDMTERYAMMLREHLSDPSLKPPEPAKEE